ncbi:MAG TPA: PilZ domain-containing protein [Myxococcales bacterium]|nr:PilZ domain-containing protein [Myxococcales bacterium]HXZ26571.1 PilZ domain-containing protein [Terriglobales bacterium]
MSPSSQERRNARRFSLSLPLALEAAGQPARATETRDVSARGVYFLLDSGLQEGVSFEFTLTLPPEMTMTESVQVRCRARVVRVRSEDDKVGVAAVIEQYDFLEEG